jgi:apolipoprotein N-acyltransferase
MRLGSALLLGVPTRDARTMNAGRGFDAYNSVAVLGEGSGLYHKRRMVPFGEYVPLESRAARADRFFDLPMSNFSAAAAHAGATAVAHGVRNRAVRCATRSPTRTRSAAGAREAALLLTVSNDTWFGASIGPLQHLQMARVRALETGRPLIRATNDGVSALIDARGRMHRPWRAVHAVRVVRGERATHARGLTPFALGLRVRTAAGGAAAAGAQRVRRPARR